MGKSTIILLGLTLMLLLCKWYIIWLMNKEKFIALAGSQSDLAKLLGIKQPAISQWKTVPQARIWQLKLLKPEWFDKV
jgi:hypothetical protein